MNVERRIKETFSEWIAFSGTRSGAPLKSRQDVYPLIRLPKYTDILDGDIPISKSEFSLWHKENSTKMHLSRPEMPIGWTTKLINLYLKSMVYMGNYGRRGLDQLIHPPIDNGLWKGIKENYKEDKSILSMTHCKSQIKDITTYEVYQKIIQGIEIISERENIKLIEVEKYWKGTEF